MGSKPEYIEANRDIINEKRRSRYSSEQRKAEYQQKRTKILKKSRLDRACCPLCGIDFRRLYIPQHIATRHNKRPKEAEADDLSIHLYGSP